MTTPTIEQKVAAGEVARETVEFIFMQAADVPALAAAHFWERLAAAELDGLAGKPYKAFWAVMRRKAEAEIKDGFRPTPMTLNEVRVFETTQLQFGQYQDRPISDVPRDYLEWLEQSSRLISKKLQRYLNSEFIRAERDVDETTSSLEEYQ